MCIQACQRCGEAYLGNPPEIGLCTACQQAEEDAEVDEEGTDEDD
jgi:hypothetical protein